MLLRPNFCTKSVFASSILHSRRFYFPNSTLRWQLPVNVRAQPNRFSSVLKASRCPRRPGPHVNVYELTFGTVAGICAGVFIKKGAKAVAFFLGGVFVLLQYFGSFGVLKVNWESMGARFQSLFYTTDPKTGSKATPTIYSAWRWLVDFLTADFQPRASFIAGLALGLRVG
ncbi:FUN14 family-domain-containing protein [Mycena latifolia]|nr:FUN14 family-domain-containing protein [Mycena latifolia]